MKTIILYSSETGFTKQYAEWISEELNCECQELKEFDKKLADYDMAIYGGSIFAGKIRDLDKFQQLNPKSYIVFAVGMTEDNGNYADELKKANPLEKVPLFYLQGGARFSKLGFMNRTILKKVTKMKNDVDYTDKANIAKLVDFVKKREKMKDYKKK